MDIASSWQARGAVPFPLNTSSFQSFTNVLVCVGCMAAGTLLVLVPCMLRKVRGSQGHGVAGSAPHREETGLSLRKAGNFLF